jgi:hypothetical protein
VVVDSQHHQVSPDQLLFIFSLSLKVFVSGSIVDRYRAHHFGLLNLFREDYCLKQDRLWLENCIFRTISILEWVCQVSLGFRSWLWEFWVRARPEVWLASRPKVAKMEMVSIVQFCLDSEKSHRFALTHFQMLQKASLWAKRLDLCSALWFDKARDY